MDKRVFIAAAASVLILIGWQQLFPPAPPPTPPPIEVVEETEAPAPGVRDEERGELSPRAEPDAVAEPIVAELELVADDSEREIRIDNGLFGVTLTNRGAVAKSWSLRDDTTREEPLELLPSLEAGRARTLGIELDDRGLSELLEGALYRVEQWRVKDGERVAFHWADGRGIEARKTLTFYDDRYLVDVKLEVKDRGRRLPARLLLGPGFGEQGTQKSGTYYYEGLTWNRAGQVTHLNKKKTEEEIDGLDGAIRWAGLEDQYFAALVLPDAPQSRVRWSSQELLPSNGAGTNGRDGSGESVRADAGEEEEAEATRYPVVAVTVPEAGAQLFVGPKKYKLLEGLGGELEKAVWFSSYPMLAWISRKIFFGLLWIHDHTIPNYGVSIVLCTFLLRLLLFPVNQFSMVSMKKTQLQMQRLQPKIKGIKNKYKKVKDAESRAKMNQEMMDLYKREGVNPMGGVTGCLPLLAQFPILMAFYFMLIVAVELRGAPFFGWIDDLSIADPLWIMPLLMGATMFLQQKMAMSKVKDPVQQQQQKFMMIMPFVFTWICLQMPAGMVLYWFVNNVLGIGQQWLVNRHTTRLEAAAAQKA